MPNLNEPQVGFVPYDLATGREIRLAMQELRLMGKILPVGARLLVRHVFESEEDQPLEVVYAFALPRDAALKRFWISGPGFSVKSELRPVEEAERVYEDGLAAGHLAGMTRSYRDGVVNLTVGNIRPKERVTVLLELAAGVELRDNGYRFRFPFTLAPVYHRQARTFGVEPGEGEMELPADIFGDVILPTWLAADDHLHRIGFDLLAVAPGIRAEVSSPSHRLRTGQMAEGKFRVGLALAEDVPNRDLVLDVQAQEFGPHILTGMDQERKGRFAVVVPSTSFGRPSTESRRMVFVIDRSGSMEGQPMKQALQAVEACLGALTMDDQFGIVAFDDQVEIFRRELVKGTLDHRTAAQDFLRKISARGGTELLAGIKAAAQVLAGRGGDLLVLTDGQVGQTEEILAGAKATDLRLHCLGIGSASQDRFLALLARETSGISRFLTSRERVDLGALELFAAISRPVARGVKYELKSLKGGRLAPSPDSQVFNGQPVIIYGSSQDPGQGVLIIAWIEAGQARQMELPLLINENDLGETLKMLQGARLITDAEGRFSAPPDARTLKKREYTRLARLIEDLSREYGLASRRMALVAVVEREDDQGGLIPETRVVPVGMPEDTRFSAYFAPRAGMVLPISPAPYPSIGAIPPMAGDTLGLTDDLELGSPRLQMASTGSAPGFEKGEEIEFSLQERDVSSFWVEEPAPSRGVIDTLMALASLIQPDGGLPGESLERRLLSSVLAVLTFLQEGYTSGSGAFAPHLARLLAFIEGADRSTLPENLKAILPAVIETVYLQTPLPGDWLAIIDRELAGEKLDSSMIWMQIEQSLKERGV